MRIKSVAIDNILGTKHAEFGPGTLTIIEGRNGSGKTSIIDALRRVFEGGSDVGLLRRGAKFGEVVLTMDDGRKIKTRVTPKSTTYEIENPDGSAMPAPRKFIEDLADALSTDPGKLINSKPKDLAAILLEVMPIHFTREEFNACIAGSSAAERETVLRDGSSARALTLEDLDAQRQQIYDARTSLNRQLKDADATVRSLRQGLPEQDDVAWDKRAKELSDLLAEATATRTAQIAEIDGDEREAIDAIKLETQQRIDEVKKAAVVSRQQKYADIDPDIQKISAAQGEAEERMRNKDRAEGIRRSIAEWEEKSSKGSERAESCTATIDAIDRLKAQKLATLPIAGLEVKDGQVLYGGIPFEHVNLRTRIEIAFQICALRNHGALPFMLLDEAEAFDREGWEEFKAGVLASGFQVIAARVGNGDLSIQAFEEVVV